MRLLKIYAVLFISLCCVCGTCSKDKDDAGTINDGGNDGYVEPALSPDAMWVTMTSGSLPSFYGPSNTRPTLRKWIATKITAGFSGKNTVTNTDKNYMTIGFENTDKFTRFASEKVNPGGKEVVSIVLNKFSRVPAVGTFLMDVDNKEGYCWYYVYKADGTLLDSTRKQEIVSSTFNIEKITRLGGSGGVSQYKMSGSADLRVMYFKSGTASTTDIQNLQAVFSNIPLTVFE